MLTELGLRNFKAFGEDSGAERDGMHRVPLAPITLICGANSTGKSSIIQSLMLLKQSHEARTDANKMPLELVPRGDDDELIDLGSYASLVHGHNTKRDLEIEIATEDSIVRSSLKFLKQDGHANSLRTSVRLTFGANDTKGNHGLKGVNFFSLLNLDDRRAYANLNMQEASRTRSRRWHIQDKMSLRQYIAFVEALVPEDSEYGRQFQSVVQDVERYRSRWRNTIDSRPERDFPVISFPSGIPGNVEFPPEAVANQPGWERRNLSTEPLTVRYFHHISQLSHLGPIRQPPKREYPLSGRPSGNAPDSRIGKSGQNTPYLLHNRRDRISHVNEWLRKFEIPYVVNVREHSGAQGTLSISLGLQDESGVEVGLADVGFGINQFIPIILHGVVSTNTIICVEQPELHLHPRLQGRIADLLMETSMGENANQWIVETHSETLLQKFVMLVKNNKIPSTHVSFVIVGKEESAKGSSGTIEDWDVYGRWPSKASFWDPELGPTRLLV